MFDAVRKLFAATDEAQARGYTRRPVLLQRRPRAGARPARARASSPVELLFLPGTYAPCPACHGARYNPETLEVHLPRPQHRGRPGDVRRRGRRFLADVPAAARSLETLRDVGLGYLRLGQPATELSGGEAQRIKLATELQRARRGHALYLLDEPTAGLHPADVTLLLRQLHRLVDAGNTVILVEHDLDRRHRRLGHRPRPGRRRRGRPGRGDRPPGRGRPGREAPPHPTSRLGWGLSDTGVVH